MVASALALSTAGCSQFSTTGLRLRQDRSIDIVEPADGADVATPFRVRWTDTDRPANTRYAVIVNRVPMPPGEDLTWFARGDEVCERQPDCPDERYLRLRGVIITDDPEATVEIVPPVVGARESELDEIIVVRIDADGQRLDEAAFVLRLDVAPREGL
ncbi:MAG TPA: hypothetical protein DCR14_01550 [Acidimicrobiaceae bacterium]|nr:hypothetical protein [Acidimicrobiaceae bacterium]